MRTCKEIAEIWKVSERTVTKCCKSGQIPGAVKIGKSWQIPDDAEKPIDRRVVSGEHIKNQDNVGKKSLSIGISDYVRAQSEYYYADKTLLIKEFLDHKPLVSLFTRPRRFGKTLNMDMADVLELPSWIAYEEFMDSLMFDIRFQYALHTTSFQEQPVSDRTFSRFRRRCLTYEAESGTDLIHDTIIELSEEMLHLMDINGKMKRMDSLMVASNIRKLVRMELLYTCIADFVSFLHKSGMDEYLDKSGMDEYLAGMEHYYDPNDYNKVIYHSRSEDSESRIQSIPADADKLLGFCEGACNESTEYQFLIRVLKEQTIVDENGCRRLHTEWEEMK